MECREDEANDQITECTMLQRQELEVIESIYPDCVSNDISDDIIRLEVPIELQKTVKVEVVDSDSNNPVIAPSSLSILPSVLLSIVFPPTYPFKEGPQLLSIRATHLWIPHISKLQRLLQQLWTPGETALYNWIEYIRNGEFLAPLDLWSSEGNDLVVIPHLAPVALSQLLVAYDINAKNNQFSKNSYQCSVCFEYQKGSKCLLLSCDHIFCRSCLRDFWSLCIKEGDISRVGCPEQDCVKLKRVADEEEVSRVVSEDEVRRWRWLKEKAAIEKDPSIIHCPMAFCQRPVAPPAIVSGQESAWDRLRTCLHCTYSFCSFCRRSWYEFQRHEMDDKTLNEFDRHGPLNNCPISVSETLVLEYLALEENSTERAIMERRFGRTNILKLIANYQEEKENRKLIDESTTECPGCKVRVEKSLGCNHMTCVKCFQHFCFRCGQRLNAKNPYAHFSTPGMGCYQMLFDGSVGHGEFIDFGFGDL